jgi:hypothetical protein
MSSHPRKQTFVVPDLFFLKKEPKTLALRGLQFVDPSLFFFKKRTKNVGTAWLQLVEPNLFFQRAKNVGTACLQLIESKQHLGEGLEVWILEVCPPEDALGCLYILFF